MSEAFDIHGQGNKRKCSPGSIVNKFYYSTNAITTRMLAEQVHLALGLNNYQMAREIKVSTFVLSHAVHGIAGLKPRSDKDGKSSTELVIFGLFYLLQNQPK